MKKKRLLPFLAAAVFASCEKKEEPVPPAAPTAERKTPAPTKISPVADSGSAPAATNPSSNDTPATPTGTPSPQPPPAPPVVDNAIPTAKPVEGQPGFVFSPYNDKIVDVRGLPSGMLVADPTFPASEKKHFRTP